MRITGWTGLGAFLLLLATAPAAYAAQCTSQSNGNWSYWLRWSCLRVPASGDSVVVNHAITLDTSTGNLQGLTVNSGRSLIYSGDDLAINLNGPLVNNGTITVTGGASGRVVLNGDSTWSGSGSISLDYIDQNNKVLTLAVGSSLTIALSDATPLRSVPNSGFNSSATPNRTATVVLNGGTQAIDSSNGIVYPNLTLTGGTKSHAGSTLKILGALTIDSGSTLNAVNAVELGGNLVINGTLSATGWGWAFNGSSLQTISAAASFMQVAINNPQGIGLGGNLTIGDTNTGDLSMLAGKINTGSFSVVIPRPCGAGWLSSRAAGSWINGNLQLTAPSYGTSCFFPIGDANNFAPMTFTYPWHDPPLGGTITGRTTMGDHPDTGSGTSGISVSKSVNRYWTLARNTGTFYTFDAILQYCNSSGTADCGVNDVDVAANPANFVVAKKSAGVWTAATPTSPTPASRQITGATAFGDLAIGEAGSALTCLTDDFTKGLNTSLWNVAGSGYTPQVVTSPTVPSSRLRLTDNQSNRATFAQLKKWFPAANNRVVVEFDYFGWGGSGADGVAVVLSDASVPPSPGGYGGSMGYANRSSIDGFNGGWIGIALDEFGNYPNSTEARRGYPAGYTPPAGANVSAGSYPNSIAVRGSGAGQTGYALLANKGTLSPALTTTNNSSHRYRIVMDHSNSANAYVSVERNTGSGFVTAVPAFDVRGANSGQSPIPANMLLSFTGSTGGSTNNHEISNVSICATHIKDVGDSTPAANFECVESGTVSPWTTTARKPLYTKLTDTGFKFDVVALKADGTIENGYVAAGGDPKSVTVALFDDSASPSPACSAYTDPVASQALTYASGDGGRKTIASSFNLDRAWGKLRCRVTDANATQTVYGCSSDTFTVRPQAISSVSSSANADGSGTSASATRSVVRAGTSFSITAGTNKVGYGGTPKIDTAKIEWAGMPSGGALGTISGSFTTAASQSTGNGATGSAFSYSEVGYFRLLAQGVFDDTFTTISSDATSSDCTDDFSNTPVDGKYGCKFGTKTATDYFGRFVPDHFTSVGAVDSTCVSGTTFPTYMEQPFTLSRSGDTSKAELVEARNAAEAVTKNYSGSYAKGAVIFGAENADNATDLSSRLVFSSAPFPALSGSWGSGIYTLTGNDASVMFKRPTTSSPDTTWGPFDTLDIGLTVKDTDVSASETISGADMNPGVAGGTSFSYKKFSGTPLLMRYGRLRLLNANGSRILDLPMAMRAEYWKSAANGWQVNSEDICTKATLSFAPVGSFDTSKTCVWDTGTAPGNSGVGCTSSAAPSGKQFKEAGVTGFAGDFNLWLKAPNVAGALDVTVTDVPDWLKFHWTSATSLSSPTARATFGISKSGKVIHLREMY